MSWYLRLRNVFRSQRLNGELDTEFGFHLAETVDRLVSEGMSRGDALRQARLRFGNYVAHKERTPRYDCRYMAGGNTRRPHLWCALNAVAARVCLCSCDVARIGYRREHGHISARECVA